MKSRFGLALLAFFCPPLYFFMRKRILAGVIHTVIYLMALVLTVVGIGFFMWILQVAHAMFDLSTLKQQDHIDRQAAAIAHEISKA